MNKVKLAELILERGDLQKKIEQLKARLNNNALVQENTKTPENPIDIIGDLNSSFERLEFLINKINESNNSTGLYKLLNKRDLLKSKISGLRSFQSNLNSGISRYTKTEIAILPNYSARLLEKEIDLLSKEFRLVDTQIQSQNWLVEVEI